MECFVVVSVSIKRAHTMEINIFTRKREREREKKKFLLMRVIIREQ